MKWREQQKDKRAEEQAGVEAERRKRGNLTGREIFAEASCFRTPPSLCVFTACLMQPTDIA